jgi:predicted GNAT family acetyltransferase
MNSMKHLADKLKFIMEIEEKLVGTLFYRKLSTENHFEYYFVEINEDYSGKGYAQTLAEYSFDHALKNDWKVKVTCNYLKKKYIPKTNDKYKEILLE